MNYSDKKTKKDKVDKKAGNEDLTSLIFLDAPKEAPKIRMISLFGNLGEDETAELSQSLIALKEYGKEEIYEDPEDPASPVKEVIYKPIDFYISTWGGDARGMFAVYDSMRMVRESCEIRTHGLGKVMSAGVLLLAAGTKGARKIGKNCRVMLHSIRGDQWGPLHNLENEMEEMRWIQEQHIDALVQETDITKKHLKKLLDRKVNVYLDAKEAVEYGIADVIV
jgi:ATP-dependent Clp endopeptidase proteolytic subunit ClpP